MSFLGSFWRLLSHRNPEMAPKIIPKLNRKSEKTSKKDFNADLVLSNFRTTVGVHFRKKKNLLTKVARPEIYGGKWHLS